MERQPPETSGPAITHVIWDWNGTLFDDVAVCVTSINQVLTEFGLPTLDGTAAYQRVFRFPIVDYYADLGFDVRPGGNFDAAARRFITVYHERSLACDLYAGAIETLGVLQRTGVRQVVISASEQGNLDAQMRPFALDRWLAGAQGIGDIYARSKQHLVDDYLRAHNADPRTVVMVGDSEHDHEIADAAGVRCVLYSRGHHARDHLEGLGAAVIDDLTALPALLGLAPAPAS